MIDFEPLGTLFAVGGLKADLTLIERCVTLHFEYVYENGADSLNLITHTYKTKLRLTRRLGVGIFLN